MATQFKDLQPRLFSEDNLQAKPALELVGVSADALDAEDLSVDIDETDRLPLRVALPIIVGVSLGLWAAIIFAWFQISKWMDALFAVNS